MFAHWKLPRLALACAMACAAVGGCAGLPRIDPSGNHVFIWPKDQPKPAAILAPPSAIVAPPVTTDPVFPQVAAPPVAAAPATIAVAPGATPTSVAMPQTPQDKVNITPARILAPVGSEVVLKASVCAIEGWTLADQKVEWMLGRNGVGQFVEVGGKGLFHPALLPWNKSSKVDNYLATGYTAKDKMCIDRGTPDPADDVNIARGDAWISVTSPNEGTSYVTAFVPSVDSWDTRKASATIYWIDVQWNFPPPTVAGGGRSATLTTTVTRQSNGTPIEGWIVKYDIADGGGNLSGGAGGQTVEVRTDAEGKASVVATPTAAGAASTPVNIQLIRPPGFGGSDAPRLVVGTSTSLIQWGGDSTYLPPANPGGVAPAPGGGSGAPITPIPTIPSTTPSPGAGGPYTPPNIPAQRAQLELTLGGDATAVKDGVANLIMTIRNVGTAPATNVQAEDRLDPGLMDPQHPDSTVIAFTGIGTIAPGQALSKTVPINVMQAGTLCHNVTVRFAEGSERTSRWCITASQPVAEKTGVVRVRKEGPVRGAVGEVVKFRVTVRNEGDLPLTDVRVIDEYPTPFFRITSTGELNAQVISGTITRLIPRLDIGTTKTFDVEVQCLQAARPVLPRPSVRVEALTDPRTRPLVNADDADFEITPALPPGGVGAGAGPSPITTAKLKLDLQFLAASGRIGSKNTCMVTVVNSSTVPDQNVELLMVLPPQLTPDTTTMQLPTNVRPTLNGNQLRFSPVAALAPGERLMYTIPMAVGGTSGFADVAAYVRSTNAPGSGVQQKTTLEILSQ